MSIVEVIEWKFPNQQGMRCKEIDGVMEIIGFPGGIPSQADQDLWTQEYNDWVASGGLDIEKADIEKNFDDLLKAFALVLLDEINTLRVAAGLNPRTVNQLKTAIRSKL